jgi:hypothetical protein
VKQPWEDFGDDEENERDLEEEMMRKPTKPKPAVRFNKTKYSFQLTDASVSTPPRKSPPKHRLHARAFLRSEHSRPPLCVRRVVPL